MHSRALYLGAILVVVAVFASGFFAYPMVVHPQAGGTSEGIPIGGYFVISFYHADGTLFATWQGHNSLYVAGINSLAECMSGQDLPPVLGTCEGPLAYVWVDNGGNAQYNGAATSTLYPSGCNPNGNPGTCTGWQTKGTITFSSGTFPVSMSRAGTEGSSQFPFDLVSITPVAVNQGDTMSVTVTFSIS